MTLDSQQLAEIKSQNFDPEKYVLSFLKTVNSLEDIPEHLQDLNTAFRNKTEKLSGAMHSRYATFIDASLQFTGMETQLNQVSLKINDLKTSLKHMREIAETYVSDENSKDKQEPSLHIPPPPHYDASFAENWEDQMDIFIQTRQFDKAIAVLNSKADIVNPAIVSRWKDILGDALSEDVEKLTSGGELNQVLTWLMDLGRKEQAIVLFFEHRSWMIKTMKAAIKFQGDIVTYIKELSVSFFTSLVKGVEQFVLMFRDLGRMGDYIAWALNSVMNFCDTFRMQVLSSGSLRCIGESMKTALSEAERAELSGLPFVAFVEKRFREDIKEAMASWDVERLFAQLIEEDASNGWIPRELTMAQLTESVQTQSNDRNHMLVEEADEREMLGGVRSEMESGGNFVSEDGRKMDIGDGDAGFEVELVGMGDVEETYGQSSTPTNFTKIGSASRVDGGDGNEGPEELVGGLSEEQGNSREDVVGKVRSTIRGAEKKPDQTYRILRCGQHFFSSMTGYLQEVKLITAVDVQSEVLRWVLSLFNVFFSLLTKKAELTFVYQSERQFVSLLSTMTVIVSNVVDPLIGDAALDGNNEILLLSKKLHQVIDTFTSRFQVTYAVMLLKYTLTLNQIDYSKRAFNKEDPQFPSTPFLSLASRIESLTAVSRSTFPFQHPKLIVSDCIMHIVRLLGRLNVEGQPEEFDKESPLLITRIGSGGLHQLLVDICFLKRAFRIFQNEEITGYFEKLINRIKRIYEEMNRLPSENQQVMETSQYEELGDYAFMNCADKLDALLYQT